MTSSPVAKMNFSFTKVSITAITWPCSEISPTHILCILSKQASTGSLLNTQVQQGPC